MSNTSLLGSFGGLGESSLQFRNVLINGCFRVWQRATSQTSSDYGSDDRWFNLSITSTKTHSRQTFTLGQTDVPGNPQYFSRTVVSSVANAASAVLKRQKIESVLTFAGQTATLSFWAKADASKNMAIEFSQNFGTGGSPSAAINAISVNTIALTTSWKYYTITVNLPSVAGKTLGTNNDDNVQIDFWFDAGSSFNARTNSLGQQSGTFDIAQVQFEAGPTATPFERRPIGVETVLAMRYYEHIVTTTTDTAPAFNMFRGATYWEAVIPFKVEKRATPSLVTSDGAAVAPFTGGTWGSTGGPTGFNYNTGASITGSGVVVDFWSISSKSVLIRISNGSGTQGSIGMLEGLYVGKKVGISAEL